MCYVFCSQVEYGIVCFISKKNDIFRFSNNYLFCSDVFLKIKLHLNLTVDILLLDKTDYCSTDIKRCVRYITLDDSNACYKIFCPSHSLIKSFHSRLLTGFLNNHIELNVLVEGYKKVCKDSFLFCSSIIHKKKIFFL